MNSKNYDKALNHYNEALNFCVNKKLLKSKIYVKIGDIHQILGDCNKAFITFSNALDIVNVLINTDLL